MAQVTQQMVDESLMYIKGLGGKVSRYDFDKYITNNIKIEQSFNSVPQKLIEEKLIEIIRLEGSHQINLTELGNNRVAHLLKNKFIL